MMFVFQKGQIIDNRYTVVFLHKEGSWSGTTPFLESSLPLVNGCSGALFIKNVFEGGMLPVAGGSTFWFTLTATTSKLAQW